jgi:hypothetical protein
MVRFLLKPTKCSVVFCIFLPVVDKNITNAADESRLSQKKTNLSFIVEIQIKCHIFDIIIHTDVGSRDLYELARISAHWSKL